MLFCLKNHDIHIKVEYDENASSPRIIDKYGSTFITFERNYSSPDEHNFNSFEDVLRYLGTKSTGNMYNDLESLQQTSLKKGFVALPVWKYHHGNICYCASEHYPFSDNAYSNNKTGYEGGFDGGLCGIIFAKRNRKKVDSVKEELRFEVEKYNYWANGDVYFISIYKQGKLIDSCRGFYSKKIDKSFIIQYAKDYLNLKLSEFDII